MNMFNYMYSNCRDEICVYLRNVQVVVILALKGMIAFDFLEDIDHVQQWIIYIIIPEGHVSSLNLTRCLLKDERQRWSAEQLLEHQFFKSPVEHGLSPQWNIEENQVDSHEVYSFLSCKATVQREHAILEEHAASVQGVEG